MQKVITINLNGNAYQLDEQGYEALRAYLEQAETQLGANPDKAEIIRDLEQAIAEKCLRLIGPAKSVVTMAEIAQILREVGPVESAGSAPQSAPSEDVPQPKRLYQIREGAMVSGVANGLAAHFNVDPTIVRVVFVVAAVVEMMHYHHDLPVLSGGLYLLLMFIVPYAKTSEQRAAAQGASAGLPYKLQTIVERVKAKIPGLHPRTH